MTMISKVYVVEGENEWWIDSGATRHVCKNRNLFATYESIEDGKTLYMETFTTVAVLGKCNIKLEFTSGKTLTIH